MATPVGRTTRSPGWSTASTVVTRSAPASPGLAYVGTGTSGSSRVSRTSTGSAPAAPGPSVDTRGETTLSAVSGTADQLPSVPSPPTPGPGFAERLTVPWWWWLI